MTERNFPMRLSCQYEEPDNSVAELRVQNFEEGEWRELDLNMLSAGFVIFAYSILTCQHHYFRVNTAERGLILASATGSLRLTAGDDWDLQRIRIRFEGKLNRGVASQGDLHYIVERMKQCPVSRNIKEVVDTETEVEFR